MRNLYFIVFILILCSCARQGAPTGGPKDVTPPAADSTKSTPFGSVNFSDKKFELHFNEWVTLSDAATQIVVSPPLKKRPDVSLKGKKVIVEFSEVDTLRPNTTYTVNFGNSIKDLHENNPAKDLRFVFSTGAFIDSLQLEGSVVDAFTGQPVENASVLLYDRFEDSIVVLEKPFYFGKTDKSGVFSLKNLKSGAFKCVIIDDANQNLKWESGDERIGKSENPVQIRDSMRGLPPIPVFKVVPKISLSEKILDRYGYLKLTWNTRPLDDIRLEADRPGIFLKKEFLGDSVLLWYDLRDSIGWKLFAGADTLEIKALSRTRFLQNHVLRFADDAPPPKVDAARQRAGQQTPAPPPAAEGTAKTINITPVKTLDLQFNRPVEAFDAARWLLSADSQAVSGFTVELAENKPRSTRFNLSWREGETYTLTLLPGAVRDIYGVENRDTLVRKINVQTNKSLGTINLKIEDLQPKTAYILQLYNGNTLEEERLFESELTEKTLVFSHYAPANYSVRLTEDLNRNGRWDTGDYYASRPPEKTVLKKLDPLRANWELEARVSLVPDNGENKRLIQKN